LSLLEALVSRSIRLKVPLSPSIRSSTIATIEPELLRLLRPYSDRSSQSNAPGRVPLQVQVVDWRPWRSAMARCRVTTTGHLRSKQVLPPAPSCRAVVQRTTGLRAARRPTRFATATACGVSFLLNGSTIAKKINLIGTIDCTNDADNT
jgi:hypothetical protein